MSILSDLIVLRKALRIEGGEALLEKMQRRLRVVVHHDEVRLIPAMEIFLSREDRQDRALDPGKLLGFPVIVVDDHNPTDPTDSGFLSFTESG
jgi:uncharacterized HAD superfamily protein